MAELNKTTYSVTMSKDTIEIETPTEKLVIKSEKQDKTYENPRVDSSSVGQPNGVDHEGSSGSNVDVDSVEDSEGLSRIHRVSNSSVMECEDVNNSNINSSTVNNSNINNSTVNNSNINNSSVMECEDGGREDEEAINREVKEVIEYMLDLVEVVVPYAPCGREKKSEREKKGDESQDEDLSDVEEDCLEVIEEKLPVEMIVEVEPKKVDEDVHILEHVPTGLCFICSSSKKYSQVLKNGRIESICSEGCLLKYQTVSGMKCIQCKSHLPADSTIYHPKFGAIGSNICSFSCLNKYEEMKGPRAKCRSCMKTVTSSGKSYHWQTMDFCSSKCIENVLKSVGGFCVNCKSSVSDSALGKYSVRFGDVVRQFCCVKCLEQYKRRLKSCSFCQKELNQSTKQTVYFKDVNGPMKPRDFCNGICVSSYKELREKKLQQEMSNEGEFEEADFCSICAVYVETSTDPGSLDTYKIDHADQTFFCCSSTCVSALRYQLGIKSLLCDGCYKYNWPLAPGTVLRYSGKVKIFCTKRCQSLFVLRTRRIQACICCRVKKYAFDLVEQYNHDTGLSVLFCSLNCMNILVDTDNVNEKIGRMNVFVDTDNVNEKIGRMNILVGRENVNERSERIGKKMHHAKCFTCKKTARESESKIFHSEDPTRGILSFCSYQCIIQYKSRLRQEAEEARLNQQLLARHAANRLPSLPSTPGEKTWTPAFGSATFGSTLGSATFGSTNSREQNDQEPRSGQSDVSPGKTSESVLAPRHSYSTRTATGSVPTPPKLVQAPKLVPAPKLVQTQGQTVPRTQQRPLPNILQRQNPNLTATLNGIGQQVRQQVSIPQSHQIQSHQIQSHQIQSHQIQQKNVLLMKQPAKQMVNKCLQVSSSCVTKATQCRPSTREMAVQTEE